MKKLMLHAFLILPMLFITACDDDNGIDGNGTAEKQPFFENEQRDMQFSASGEIYKTLQSSDFLFPDFLISDKLTPEPALFNSDKWGAVYYYDIDKIPEPVNDEIYVHATDFFNHYNKDEKIFTYKWLTIKSHGAYHTFHAAPNTEPESRSIFMVYKPVWIPSICTYYYNNFIEIRQVGCEPAHAE